MEARQFIVTQVHEACRGLKVDYLFGSPSWSDATFFRACALRLARGDDAAWQEFIERLRADRELTCKVREMLIDRAVLRETSSRSFQVEFHLPADVTPFSRSKAKEFLFTLDIWTRDKVLLPNSRVPWLDLPGLGRVTDRKAFIPPSKPSRSEIMYIEMKPGLTGPGRIGRVQFSQTGKTIYYRDTKLQSLKGSGINANYFNVETAMWYWVSGCKKDGSDKLYPGFIAIDEEVREEYWTTIRELPQSKHLKTFRSPGKYSKHRPR